VLLVIPVLCKVDIARLLQGARVLYIIGTENSHCSNGELFKFILEGVFGRGKQWVHIFCVIVLEGWVPTMA